MTRPEQAWGAAPSANYEALANRFRPIFDRIAEGVLKREQSRELPFEQIGWLKEAGFGAVRVPVSEGGAGATLPDLFGLLIELSEADSNVTQALRAHFGWAENIVNTLDPDIRRHGVDRLLANTTAGSAWSEIGNANQAAFSTALFREGERLTISGEKFYTTGSLFADWIDIGATDADGTDIGVLVPRDALGVQIVDDWDGFGQRLTASGSTIFDKVAVDPADVIESDRKFKYGAAFYQTVHLATLAGIGRAIVRDVNRELLARRRSFTSGNGPIPANDPQLLQIAGKLRAAAFSAGVLVLNLGNALERPFRTRFGTDEDADLQANITAELEVAQTQNLVIDLILGAATSLFDALSASHTRSGLLLDRHWRNARTLASHNPRVYKERIVGDWAVNGNSPPFQWRIGIA